MTESFEDFKHAGFQVNLQLSFAVLTLYLFVELF